MPECWRHDNMTKQILRLKDSPDIAINTQQNNILINQEADEVKIVKFLEL